MRALLVATLLLAAGCRTGSLGHCNSDSDCAAGATCDAAERVCTVRAGGCFPSCGAGLTCQSAACVDVTPPTITAIAVTTPPDFAPGIYKGDDSATLSVSAQIADVSGVRNACLQVSGETACPHPGSSADGGLWTFTMPRAPASGTLDGAPVAFTIEADDAPAGSAPNHGTATSFIRFDNAGPDIRIASDPQPFARLLADGGVDVIPLQVTITDATGVCQTAVCKPRLTFGAGTPVFATQDGGTFLFDLDATKAAAGAEGPLSFTVTAEDALGHQATATGSRLVDDKAPVVTLKVFRDGDAEPATGAGFPPAVANTGHDGVTFVYSDVVHLKGSVADEGGIGTVTWRIDGVAMDGGVSTGTSQTTCDGGTVCAFDVQVALNGAGNGELHTTTANLVTGTNLSATNGATRIPIAALHVVLTASDRTRSAGGESRAKQTVRDVAARTTRFLWLRNLPTGSIVSGLSIHPGGDVIVTSEGAGTGFADEVFAVPSTGPLSDGGFPLHWSFGFDAGFGAGGLGDIVDMPAVGAGDGATAPIYVATTGGGVFALSPSGTVSWSTTGLQELWTAPAVVGVQAGEAVVIPSAATPASASKVFTVGSSGGSVFVLDAGVDDIDLNSAPLVLDGGAYFGTQTSLYRLDLSSGGLTKANAGGEIWGPVTDGGAVYTSTIAAATATLSTFSPALVLSNPAVPVAGAVNQDLIVDMIGRIIASTRTSRLVSIDATTGGLFDVGLNLESTTTDGDAPLQGSDGTIYLPRSTGFLLAFRDGQTSWTFDPNGTVFRAPAMDCAGRLYVASDETIYAFVTDDHGLADAPWPTYRRDSRATGNFGAPKYGVRLPGPDGGICNN
ncbi:MAG: hypothetical protein ACJ79H_13240 [Myxococcales bacterium]